ncbi:MAG: HlyC/CorC family transporter [Spirochaetes bacterium]|nr:HlyC/CorC family transporter [Spirochaetota bacterium]
MYLLIIFPIIIFILILIQGFFSNSEMAMVSSNKIRLQYLTKNGNKKAFIIQNLLNNPEKLFGTTLVGINLATVLASTIADYYFHNFIIKYLPNINEIISTEILILIIMGPLILIFGELFPMSIARKHPTTTALKNAIKIKIGYIILFPLMLIPSFISKAISMLFKNDKTNFGKISREELEIMVTGGFANITYKTQEYIKELFNINELTASDVMVHLNNVKVINEEASIEDLKKIINSTNHSRIPIYQKNIFNIAATVHAVNILGADDKESIMQYTDKLYIVPSSKPIIQILSEFKRNRKYMGIVVDEYGAVCGIITLEDILEEIVGEINDEFDIPKIEKHKKNKDIFDASIKLDDFYEQTGIDFRDNEAETLGGIINLAKGRIARKNEKIVFKNIHFEVVDATNKVVKSVKLIGHNK